MSADVFDLLSRRQRRGEHVVHFASAREALDFATAQVCDLERLAGSAMFLSAEELSLPLSQAAAILAECSRLHAELRTHQETS